MAIFLNVPVRTGAPARFITVFYQEKEVRKEQLQISSRPDMWASIPLPDGEPDGYSFSLTGDGAEPLREKIALSSRRFGEEDLYREPLRPLNHFTPARGFMNDPNGLYFDGREYHMFFQLNPFGLGHGNTHWGHAVSRDLLHWTEREPALCPDDADGLIFSGSAVIDRENVSGLGDGSTPPVILFYTATGMRFRPDFPKDETGAPVPPAGWKRPATPQCAAYSLDGGRTFRKYGPVVPEIEPMNRDPKVQWVPEAGCWVMALYLIDNDYALLYSDDLLHWELGERMTLPGTAECPDLFRLYLDGDRAKPYWVYFGSPENYLVGTFEGRKFVHGGLIRGCTQPESGEVKVFTDAAAYAPQTFFGTADGEVVQLSWIPTRFPGEAFASCMSLPWKLELRSTDDGPRLYKSPAEAVNALREGETPLSGGFAEVSASLRQARGDALELAADLTFQPEGALTLSVRGALLSIREGGRKLLFPTGVYSLPGDGTGTLRVFADRGSLELFYNGFACALNAPLDPSRQRIELLEMEGCSLSGSAWTLRDARPEGREG